MEKVLLNRRETSEALGLSLRAVDYLIADKRLRAVRVGKRVMVPKAALEHFIRQDQSAPITK